MTNAKITATREILFDETYALKRDAMQIVEDAKNNLYAHLALAMETANNALDQARSYTIKRFLQAAAFALSIAFFIGTFRRS